MNPLAIELNEKLSGCVAGRLLSGFGRRIYFPNGIIAQGAQAKKQAHFANATIGMAYSLGKPLMLSTLARYMPMFTSSEIVAYAPTAGIEEVRILWKKLLLEKNPSLNENFISLPVVVPGITAGISYTADLFLDETSTILASYPSWDNYKLIFEDRSGAKLLGIPFFNKEDGLDLEKIGNAIDEEAKKGSVRMILNFPNNPSGYSPTKREVDALSGCFVNAAEKGADVLVICDDAYFGLFYEEETCKESIFSHLCGAHERILAVKTDGPTKEDYSWGFRIAMITMGSKGLNQTQFDAINTKLMGTIRSSVSCSNTPAQNFFLKTCGDKNTLPEKEGLFNLLKRRYKTVKKVVEENAGNRFLTPLPFNSGYFMCMHCNGIDAELLRKKLLAEHGIGVVALGQDYIRLAFSSFEEAEIPKVFKIVYKTAGEIQ